MNGRLKLKGRVFTHLIYPCIMSVVLFVVGIWITVIDSDDYSESGYRVSDLYDCNVCGKSETGNAGAD